MKNKKLLNEELNKIKSMMRKLNENMYDRYDSRGNYMGGSDPRFEVDDSHLEQGVEDAIDKVKNLIGEKFPDLKDNLDVEYIDLKEDKNSVYNAVIKVSTKDGSYFSEDLAEEFDNNFKMTDLQHDFAVIEVFVYDDSRDF